MAENFEQEDLESTIHDQMRLSGLSEAGMEFRHFILCREFDFFLQHKEENILQDEAKF